MRRFATLICLLALAGFIAVEARPAQDPQTESPSASVEFSEKVPGIPPVQQSYPPAEPGEDDIPELSTDSETSPLPNTDRKATVETSQQVEASPQDELVASQTMIGDKVENAAGEELGTIHDLAVDASDGSVEYAIISEGGFLGIGAKYIAVPWEEMKRDEASERFVLELTLEQADVMEGINLNELPTKGQIEAQFRRVTAG